MYFGSRSPIYHVQSASILWKLQVPIESHHRKKSPCWVRWLCADTEPILCTHGVKSDVLECLALSIGWWFWNRIVCACNVIHPLDGENMFTRPSVLTQNFDWLAVSCSSRDCQLWSGPKALCYVPCVHNYNVVERRLALAKSCQSNFDDHRESIARNSGCNCSTLLGLSGLNMVLLDRTFYGQSQRTGPKAVVQPRLLVSISR